MSADATDRQAEESGSDLDINPDDEVDGESDSPPTFTGKGKGKAKAAASPVPSSHSNDVERLAITAPPESRTDSEKQANPVNTASHQQGGEKSIRPRGTTSSFTQDAPDGFRGSRGVLVESSDSDMDSEITPSESGGEAGMEPRVSRHICAEISLL